MSSSLTYEDLMDYQKDGVNRIQRQPRLFLGDDPGLGKTAQVVVGFSQVPKEIQRKGILIICPASLRTNWAKEWKLWGGPTDVEVYFMSYQEATRDAQGKPPPKGKTRVGVLERNWGCVAFDECHALKAGSKSQRGRDLIYSIYRSDELDEMGLHTGRYNWVKSYGIKGTYMVMMSGTPILNKPVDVFPMIRHLDPKSWPGKSQFEMRYCDAGINHFGRYEANGAKNLPELRDKLTNGVDGRPGVMLRRLKKNVLTELPPKRRQIIEMERTTSVGVAESQLAKVAGIDQLEDDSDMKWAVRAMDQMAKIKLHDLMAIRQRLGMSKIKPVIKYIKEMEQLGVLPNKLVIFAHHREVIEELTEEINKLGIKAAKYYGGMNDQEKNSVVEDFQKGDLRVFVGSIIAAGVGLTLTQADTCMIVEASYVPAENVQAEDRIHRIGAVNPVLIQYLVFAGSLDSRILSAVVDKMDMINEITG